jgi:lipopolysaccharide transport system permease protein
MKKQQQIIIDSNKQKQQYWIDLWSYRGLFYFLSWKDVLVRYKQTVVGIAWSVIRPLLTMIIFVLIFSKVAKLPSDGDVPYAIMVFAALLPWQFFANALSDSGNSLVENADMVGKVFFPRVIIPASTIIVSLLDFCISFLILLILMIWYQFTPNVTILFLPFFLLLAIINALGLGLWLSALNVTYRDFRYVIPFIVQFGLYLSPVGFSSSIVPEGWRFLYSLNPMVGVIDGFRWSILGSENSIIYMPGFLISIFISLLVLYSGIRFFRKKEKTFADVI